VDCAINYKTEDVSKVVREFTKEKGVDIWFETQREQDFGRTFDLLARRGRMILMAGRQARPILPVGSFYPRDLTLYRFATVTATSEERRGCAKALTVWLGDQKLHAAVGRTFPLAQPAEAHRLQEENSLNKSGTLTGKIVVMP